MSNLFDLAKVLSKVYILDQLALSACIMLCKTGWDQFMGSLGNLGCFCLLFLVYKQAYKSHDGYIELF